MFLSHNDMVFLYVLFLYIYLNFRLNFLLFLISYFILFKKKCMEKIFLLKNLHPSINNGVKMN